MKYILCILFSILLARGIELIPVTDCQHELRTEAGDISVQSPKESTCFVSVSVNAHGLQNDHAFSDEIANCKFNDGILCSASVPQCTVPSKTLKFNATNIVMQILSIKNSPLPDNKWEKHSSDIKYRKYSNQYYVYTLGHILI